MTWALDHLFVISPIGAPAADALVAAGFIEGSPNVHPGQGTANRRFFFDNLMLELLWVHDLAEARSPEIVRTGLAARADGGCPFGICLRPATEPAGPLPFESWDYRPPYLPSHLHIPMATSTDRPDEPVLFALPWVGASPKPTAEPTRHPNGAHRVRAVTVDLPKPVPTWSDDLQATANRVPDLTIQTAPAARMTVDVGLEAAVDLGELRLV